ncbi:hypothetical protein CRV24_008806 [Beauveria bassiana]|nr:hypothetical protein CRV24_008806 [Beauveria bassiana]
MEPHGNRKIRLGPARLRHRPRVQTQQIRPFPLAVQHHAQQHAVVLVHRARPRHKDALARRVALWSAPDERVARHQVRLGQTLANRRAEAAARHAVHVAVRLARERRVNGWQFANVRRRDREHLGRRGSSSSGGGGYLRLTVRWEGEAPTNKPRPHRLGSRPVSPERVGGTVAPQNHVVSRLSEPRHHAAAAAASPVDDNPLARRRRRCPVKRLDRVEHVALPEDLGAEPRKVRRRHAQHHVVLRQEEAVNVRRADVPRRHGRQDVGRARRGVDAEEAVLWDAAKLEVYVEQVARRLVALCVRYGQRPPEVWVEALRLRAVVDRLERVLVEDLKDRLVRRYGNVTRRDDGMARRRRRHLVLIQAGHVA